MVQTLITPPAVHPTYIRKHLTMLTQEVCWKSIIFPTDTLDHLEEKFGDEFVSAVQQKYSLSSTGMICRDEYYQTMPRGGVKFIPQRIWNGNPDKDGYRLVSISGHGKEHTMRLHRLVGFTFLPWIDIYSQIDHKNGIKWDNRVENIQWVTASENVRRKFKLNLDSTKGSCNGKAKLTEPKVINIKRVLSNGGRRSLLADFYGVTTTTIDAIANGVTWKHVTDTNWDRKVMNINRSQFALC